MNRVLLIACGALVREIRAVFEQLNNAETATTVAIEWLPAPLHNRPEQIPDAIRSVVAARAGTYDHVVLGYGDCGTGGMLDVLCEELNAIRLPGPHCYSFFAGAPIFDQIQSEELGTFYLTDFLARNFDALVIRGLGLDEHPQLRDTYFGNYRRLVLLRQTDDPALIAVGRAAADRLGLSFEDRFTGLAPFESSLLAALAGAETNPSRAIDTKRKVSTVP